MSSAKPSSPPLPPSETATNLPPQRPLNTQNKLNPLLRNVSPPLSTTRLSTLIYVLVGLSALLSAYLSWRSVAFKGEVGGLGGWGFLVGRGPSGSGSGGSSGAEKAGTNTDSIESHVLALASLLGVPTHELASAIAGAVRAYVPPASLASIRDKGEETGDVVSVLLQEPRPTAVGGDGGGGGEEEHGAAWEAAATAAGVMGGVVGGVESFVGMDEP